MKPWWIVRITYVEIRYISTGVGIKHPPPSHKKNKVPSPLIHIIEYVHPPPAMIAGSMANATTPDHIAANNGTVAGAAAIAAAAALPSLQANTNAKNGCTYFKFNI